MISVIRLGFWTALLTAALTAVFFGVGIFGSSAFNGSISYPYVLSTIRPIDYAVWIPGIFLAPTLVVLIACIHVQSPTDKKIFSQIALCFALLFAGIVTADYFIQLTVVLPSILSKETEGLSLFSMYNPHGILVSLESLGYLLLNSAFLSLVGVFVGKNKLERAIRWIFLVAFILAVTSFGAIILAGYPIVFFEVAILTINMIVLITSGVLLSLFFRRVDEQHN